MVFRPLKGGLIAFASVKMSLNRCILHVPTMISNRSIAEPTLTLHPSINVVCANYRYRVITSLAVVVYIYYVIVHKDKYKIVCKLDVIEYLRNQNPHGMHLKFNAKISVA